MLAGKMLAAGSSIGEPTFVSSSAGAPNTTTFTITAPSGIQDGDILIVIGFQPAAAGAVTPASGFLSVCYDYTAAQYCTVFTKIANSESGDYTFTQPSANAYRYTMLVYRNATRVNTVGLVNRTTSSVTITATSITPTFKGLLIAAFHGGNANATIITPPSGMTQRSFYNASGTTTVYDLAPSLANVTGNKVLEISAAANNTAIQLQITNEPTVAPEFRGFSSDREITTGNTLNISFPVTAFAGDLVIVGMSANVNTLWSTTSGWTEIVDQGVSPSLRIVYRTVPSPQNSEAFTSVQSTGLLSGFCVIYRYAAYDTIGASLANNTNPLILPSISPSQSQSILLAVGASDLSNQTLGTPIGMTKLGEVKFNLAPSLICCGQTVAKGPVGDRSMGMPSASDAAGSMLSIKPTRSL